MIPNKIEWHCIAANELSALLSGTISKKDYFRCLNCFHSFRKKLESHKIVCKNKNFCSVRMSFRKNMLLK